MFDEGFVTDGAVITLVAFAVFAALAGFVLTGRTVHYEPCLSLAIDSQSSCLGWMRAIAFGLIKAQVLEALEPLHFQVFNHLATIGILLLVIV